MVRATVASSSVPTNALRAGPGKLAILGAGVAFFASIAAWGFTVDDALIPIAYARHLSAGLGYRFSAHGPSSDGVTPLPWAFLLVPLVAADAMTTLARVKALGIALHTAAGAVLGVAVARASTNRTDAKSPRLVAPCALVLHGLVFPIGAYAASGMETGLATALATASATFVVSRPRLAAAVAGLAACVRPEMVGWACIVGAGAFVIARPSTADETREARAVIARRVFAGASVAFAPFFACAVIRLAVFGRAAPLAVLAKPSDLGHGFAYAAAAAVFLVLPLVTLAPRAVRRADGPTRVLALALVVHLVVVVLAGGDWMPWARLVVPVVPSLALVLVGLAKVEDRRVTAARIVLAAALAAFFAIKNAPEGRTVMRDRAELVARARPLLASAKTVAALDVGWVSAATDADIVDLAGLTDPQIAMLPGGHTSKRVDTTMLLDRNVDVLVVYGASRVVEARLVRDPLFRDRFEHDATIAFGSRGATYELYRRRLTF